MAEFEPASDTQLDDGGAGIAGASRHHHRIREIAVGAMVDLMARQRIERAAKTHTRRATENSELQAGEQVEFHHPPASKDGSGWRGPATIIQVDSGSWQDRFMQCWTQDVRRALVLFAMLSVPGGEWSRTAPRGTTMTFVDTQDGRAVRLGWVLQDG